MLKSKLPARFWGEAANTANYIRNRCTSKSLGGDIAYKHWTGKSPTLSHLEPFGALTMALDKNPNKGKFEQRSKEYYFLGCSEESKAYWLWSIIEGKAIRSRGIKVIEKFRNESKKVKNLIVVSALLWGCANNVASAKTVFVFSNTDIFGSVQLRKVGFFLPGSAWNNGAIISASLEMNRW